MKITIYELLGMIKDGKAPKKIKVYGKVYINNNCNCYLDEQDKSLCNNVEIPMFLNDTVEILNEKKKIPEKLEYYDDSIAWVIDNVGQLSDVDKVIIDKLNDVIDYLKSKGE